MLVNKILLLLLLLKASDLSYPFSTIHSSYLKVNDKLRIYEMKKYIRTEEISFSSPLVLGLLGGSGVLIIAMIFIVWYCRYKKTPEDEPSVKKEDSNIKIEESVNGSNERISKKEISKEKEVTIQINDENSNEIVIDNDKEVVVENKEILQESATRNLIESDHLEIKEKRIINLFKKYSENLKDKLNLDHDKEEFFKPVTQTKTARTDFASNSSKISKVSANNNLNQENVQDLSCYISQKRESPSISFFDKSEEINHIKEIELEQRNEKIGEHMKEINEKKITKPIEIENKVTFEEKPVVTIKNNEEIKIVIEKKVSNEKKVSFEKLKSDKKPEEDNKPFKKEEEGKKPERRKKAKEKEKKKEEEKKRLENKKREEEKNKVINVDDAEDEEDVEVDYYVEKFHDKSQLQPDSEDVISDFLEKTKNIKIELFKKNTQDFDKESIDRVKPKNKKKDLFVYIDAKLKS
jgi:hypothetical protein